MRKPLDTANVRIYGGGGLVDGEFLRPVLLRRCVSTSPGPHRAIPTAPSCNATLVAGAVRSRVLEAVAG